MVLDLKFMLVKDIPHEQSNGDNLTEERNLILHLIYRN